MVYALPSRTANVSNFSRERIYQQQARATPSSCRCIINYYLEQEATKAALNFVAELETAIQHIQTYPESGSPRYAHTLSLPGLRCWPCQHFPYLIFYLEQSNCIDIWRILHQQRDIPAWLLSDESV